MIRGGAGIGARCLPSSLCWQCWGWPTYRQRQSVKYQGSQRGMYLGGEQSESEMSLCLQTVLLDERRSCLYIKKGSFVFRWRVFLSVLEVRPHITAFPALPPRLAKEAGTRLLQFYVLRGRGNIYRHSYRIRSTALVQGCS